MGSSQLKFRQCEVLGVKENRVCLTLASTPVASVEDRGLASPSNEI